MAPAKPAPEPTLAGVPHPGPVLSVYLSGTKDDSLDLSGLGAAFTELRVGTVESKQMEKEKGKEGAAIDREAAHE